MKNLTLIFEIKKKISGYRQLLQLLLMKFTFSNKFDRGPRVENLIIRLYHLPRPPQIIGLSATIDNPQTIANWLNNLETKYREKKSSNAY